MALLGPYTIAERELADCYAFIQSIAGGKDQGWTARIAVYTRGPRLARVPLSDSRPTRSAIAVAEAEPVDTEVEAIPQEKEVLDRGQSIDEFTVTAAFEEGVHPYTSCYAAAAARLGEGWVEA